MPLGLRARMNLAAAQMAGTLGFLPPRPYLSYSGFKNTPTVGQPAHLRWRAERASAVFLRVEQSDAMLCNCPVPLSGEVTLTIQAPSPVRASFRLDPLGPEEDAEPVIYQLPAVNPIIPRQRFIRIEVPQTAPLMGTFDVVWDAGEASGVDLIIDNGRTIIEEARRASGVRKIDATHVGKWMIRLTAQFPHTEVTVTRMVTISAPLPRIHVERAVLAGPPGMSGTFTWHMTDAVRAHLHAPLRNQRSEAPLEGGLPVIVGEEPEYFYLVAIGIDGSRSRVELRTEPYNLSLLSPEA
jgi:hypothetical protein